MVLDERLRQRRQGATAPLAAPRGGGRLTPPRYRWTILAVGVGAQASISALRLGLPSLAPALRSHYGLGLAQTGMVLASVSAGIVVGLLPWGELTDRVGERPVIAVGLSGAAAALVWAAFAPGFTALIAALAVAGLFGASATGATGRAVMSWFGRAERGMALGVRQTGIPLGGAFAALTLPTIAATWGLEAAMLFLAALCVAGAAAAARWLRDPPAEALSSRPLVDAPQPLRDRRIWRLGLGSGLLVVGQIGLVSFLVLYLHDERGWPAAQAAAALACVQIGGAAARIAIGRWSDRLGRRIDPLRRVGLAAAAALALATALAHAPAPVLFCALLLAGVLAMSWNGLSFTAAVEISGRHQAGRATALQNALLSLSAVGAPIAFAALVGAASWQAAWGALVFAQIAGALVIAPLAADEARRHAARTRRIAARESESATLAGAAETIATT